MEDGGCMYVWVKINSISVSCFSAGAWDVENKLLLLRADRFAVGS